MKFSNFEFLKDRFPNLYKLAYITDNIILEDPFAAMINIKQLTSNIIDIIVGNTGISLSGNHIDGLIHALWKNNIIAEDMYLILREIELFDSRESEIIIDFSRVEHIFYRVHDFSVWFYKTYVDDSYVQCVFVNSTKNEKLLATLREPKINLIDSSVDIDGTVFKVEWEKSLQVLSDFETKNYDNGEKYEGQLVRGLKNGKGIYTWRDGTVYKGNWNKDLEHGYGEKMFANGDNYRGYWKNGNFEGQGRYTWKNGQIFEGQWQDGFEHGYGTKTSNDLVKKRGYWTFGEFEYSADQLNGRDKSNSSDEEKNK